jgi:hypothetical protein
MTYNQTKYILENLPKNNCIKNNCIKNNCIDIFRDLVEYKNGLFMIVESNLQKFFERIRRMNVKCRESNVYRSKEKNPVIIKIPKKSIYHDNAIRAYYIGIELNKLEKIVPNFINTLCMFCTESMHVMVAYQCIEGKHMTSIINDMKFIDFLCIFTQILLALEVAQRQSCFCHYDLHLNNVILKKGSIVYSVILDNEKYEMSCEKYIPIILDFGLSSVVVNGKTIGCFEYDKYGIMNYGMEGVDMYKFLFHSYVCTSGNLQKEIGKLFLFYGDMDPYNVIGASKIELEDMSKNYLKDVSTSKISKYKPIDFIKWIKSYYLNNI